MLEEVSYLGRGSAQRVRYRADEAYAARRPGREPPTLANVVSSPEQLVARERLISEDVDAPIADRLVREHEPEAVFATVDMLASRPTDSVKN